MMAARNRGMKLRAKAPTPTIPTDRPMAYLLDNNYGGPDRGLDLRDGQRRP